MPTPPGPTAYRDALFRSRALQRSLSIEQARAIRAAVITWAQQLTRAMQSEFGSITDAGKLVEGRRLVRARQLALETAGRMQVAIEQSVAGNRRVAFEDTLRIWEEATASLAATRGIELKTFGAVRTPPVTLLGAFDAIGSPHTWRTLLRDHTGRAALETAQIFRLGMIEGIGPAELSRRWRRYVVGSEPFARAFENVRTLSGDVAKIDLRRIPGGTRGAARTMVFNADRLAVTEIGAARHEAEIEHAVNDPLIWAVRWTLSPNRGPTADVPDECDVLATNDVFGLGLGVYPVDQVPAKPHPFDRCENFPVETPAGQVGQAKPSPERAVAMEGFKVDGNVTPKRAARIRANAERALLQGTEALKLRGAPAAVIAGARAPTVAVPAAVGGGPSIPTLPIAPPPPPPPPPAPPPPAAATDPVLRSIDEHAAAIREVLETMTEVDETGLALNFNRVMGGQVSRVVLDSPEPDIHGALAFFRPSNQEIHVGTGTSRAYKAAVAKIRAGGRLTPDEFDGFHTVIHELHHANTYRRAGNARRTSYEPGRYIEEGIVEDRSRTIAVKAAIDPDRNHWSEYGKTWDVYRDEVASLNFVAARSTVGHRAFLDEIWSTAAATDRWARFADEVIGWAERALAQLEGIDRYPAGHRFAGTPSEVQRGLIRELATDLRDVIERSRLNQTRNPDVFSRFTGRAILKEYTVKTAWLSGRADLAIGGAIDEAELAAAILRQVLVESPTS